MPYHVRITPKSNRTHDEVKLDLDDKQLEDRFLKPYREGRTIVIGGRTIPPEDIYSIKISHTEEGSEKILPDIRARRAGSRHVAVSISDEWYVAKYGKDVTDDFITGPPGTEKRAGLAEIVWSRKVEKTLPENYISKNFEYDVFICHASEDKESFVNRLAQELVSKQLKVWYDEFELELGDSLRRKIDEGLSKSRYGVVVLSKNFFQKKWPQDELDGLAAKEREGHKVILPIWHNITQEEVESYSPMLAGRFAAQSNRGIENVCNEILKVVKPSTNGVDLSPQKSTPSEIRDDKAQKQTQKRGMLQQLLKWLKSLPRIVKFLFYLVAFLASVATIIYPLWINSTPKPELSLIVPESTSVACNKDNLTVPWGPVVTIANRKAPALDVQLIVNYKEPNSFYYANFVRYNSSAQKPNPNTYTTSFNPQEYENIGTPHWVIVSPYQAIISLGDLKQDDIIKLGIDFTGLCDTSSIKEFQAVETGYDVKSEIKTTNISWTNLNSGLQ